MISRLSKIFIAGHKGMVGSAVTRLMMHEGFTNIIVRSRNELDLLDFDQVSRFFKSSNPDYVILAAARVGGIQANISKPAEFLYENLVIQNNIIHAAYQSKVKKLVFLGSSCVYPKDCLQPMKEEFILTGPLEPTNEGYALAKIAGLKLLEFYSSQYRFNSISLMPCNLYGTNDSFHPENSHVLSSLVRKFCDAKDSGNSTVEIWGTGVARREFMHVDDMAQAILFFMERREDPKVLNVGPGTDVSILELANLISEEVQYNGEIKWDGSKPDGMLRKCMDVTKMKNEGFAPIVSLREGIKQTINEYKLIKQMNA